MRSKVSSCRVKPLQRSRRGYVLVLVLAVLTVSTTLLAQSATNAQLVSKRAIDSSRALQLRWAIASIQKASLPHGERLLQRANDNRQASAGRRLANAQPIRSMSTQVVLGEMRFTAVISDEQAKANINTLQLNSGAAGVSRAATDLLGVQGASLLRSSRGPTDLQPETLGQLFNLDQVRRWAGDDRKLAELTADITLWGNGRLNIRRAPRNAIIGICGTVLPQAAAARLYERYAESDRRLPLKLLLADVVKNDEDRSKVAALLQEQSACYSLWVEGTTTAGERLQRLSVLNVNANGEAQHQAFELD